MKTLKVQSKFLKGNDPQVQELLKVLGLNAHFVSDVTMHFAPGEIVTVTVKQYVPVQGVTKLNQIVSNYRLALIDPKQDEGVVENE